MALRDNRNLSWLYPQRRRGASATRRDANVGKNSAGRGVLENWYLADNFAPRLTGANVVRVSSTSGTPRVTTGENNGTLYMVCVANGDTPSVAQIKAGQNSAGASAINSQSQAVTTVGLQSFTTVTGLTTDTPYDFWFVHTDLGGNDSVAVKADFTPTAQQNALPLFWAFP